MRTLTLTLHPAIDRIVRLRSLVPGHIADALSGSVVPAGKGVNTARALRALLPPASTIISAAWLGPAEIPWFTQQLEMSGIRLAACPRNSTVRTRHAYTFLESSGRETHVKEIMPSPQLTEERELLSFWTKTVGLGDAVAVCGSAPVSTRVATLKKILEIARANGAGAIVADTNGPFLKVAATAALDVLKGNAAEMGQWLRLKTAFNVKNNRHCKAILSALQRAGAPRTVLITCGSKGAILASAHSIFSAWLPPVRTRSGFAATGCGDAATAGVLVALNSRTSLQDMLRWAVACGSAKLFSSDPGHLDARRVKQFLRKITVVQISGHQGSR